jgi:DNA-binding response OmpR family regulator
MRLYLDDDSVAAALVQALRRAGHDVRTPAEAGLTGAHEALHLRQALREDRALLSRNYDDFKALDLLIREAQGRHSGILMIRQDDPKKRKMKSHDIVRALSKLEAAGVTIANEYIVLNHWR